MSFWNDILSVFISAFSGYILVARDNSRHNLSPIYVRKLECSDGGVFWGITTDKKKAYRFRDESDAEDIKLNYPYMFSEFKVEPV